MTQSDDWRTNDVHETADVVMADENGPATHPFRYVQRPDSVEDSFADGAAGIVVGRNVLKLDLYRVVGMDRENEQELRTTSHRMVLPLTAVPELINLLAKYARVVEQTAQKRAESGASGTETSQ
jgi:hypothetical protein